MFFSRIFSGLSRGELYWRLLVSLFYNRKLKNVSCDEYDHERKNYIFAKLSRGTD